MHSASPTRCAHGGLAAQSPKVGTLEVGAVVTALDERVNEKGTTRVKFVRGWTSKLAGSGNVILQPLSPASPKPNPKPKQPPKDKKKKPSAPKPKPLTVAVSASEQPQPAPTPTPTPTPEPAAPKVRAVSSAADAAEEVARQRLQVCHVMVSLPSSLWVHALRCARRAGTPLTRWYP